MCGIMSVSNLKYPQWHLAPCNMKLCVDVLCTTGNWDQEHNTSIQAHRNNLNISTHLNCDSTLVLFQRQCFHISRDMSAKHAIASVKNSGFYPVLTSISRVSEAPLCFHSESEENVYLKYDKLTQEFYPISGESQSVCDVLHVRQFELNRGKFHARRLSLQIIECDSGEFVSRMLVHVLQASCLHDDKQIMPPCFSKQRPVDLRYCLDLCKWPTCHCYEMYHHKSPGGCSPYQHQCAGRTGKCLNIRITNDTNSNETFVDSINGLTLETSPDHVTDDNETQFNGTMNTDCGLNSNTEFLTLDKKCSQHDHLWCTFGCHKCFPVHKLCVYEVDQNANLMHCPSGSHLKNCVDIECNNMFKCYRHYCLPYR